MKESQGAPLILLCRKGVGKTHELFLGEKMRGMDSTGCNAA